MVDIYSGSVIELVKSVGCLDSGIPFEPAGGGGRQFMEFQDFLWHAKFIQHLDDDMLALIITIAWCLWLNCNEVRQGRPRQQGSAIVHKARYLLNEF